VAGLAGNYCRAVASQSRAAARYHGDQAAVPGMLDFAVNVRASEPPSWLVDRLAARMADLGRYPSAVDERRAVHAVAARHGRSATNPTSVLHLRDQILALRNRMTARRPHWPLGTLQLEAIVACSSPEAVSEAERGAQRLATLRAAMVAGLTSIGLDVIDGCAPFVLFTVPDAQLMRKHLDGKGVAVRRCDTFVGLDGEYLRAAVRPQWPVLVDAIAEFAAMSGLREEQVTP
jgi:histidinol-phosphate/aromatic aminotransferase/cobyric acid decarboxylase-like protein